jgi:hypothetical protein
VHDESGALDGRGGARVHAAARVLAALVLGAVLAGCEHRGARGRPGPPGADGGGGGTPSVLAPHEDPPGVVVEVLSVQGASGFDGTFQVGDHVRVAFSLKHLDGTPWALDEMLFGRALMSGPTFNYQRVLAEVSDVATGASATGPGEYVYTFALGIPATYLPPYNDTPSFGALDGELAGQPLLTGTYTIGLSFGWAYSVGTDDYLDVGEAHRDVLLGGATTLAPRAAVAQANCNQCHVELRAHGGERRDVVQCLLCHTSGAEDRNDALLGAGTPGVSVDARVLFHALHNASHLPSVLGIGVTPTGDQDYLAPRRPLVFAGADGLRDYSSTGSPVWPSRSLPRDKNFGWTALAPAAREQEDQVRRGLIACFVCHGDPDQDGPLEAPAQGTLAFVQPTRRACGACHDDVDWELPYRTNLQEMPPQADDSGCAGCHEVLPGPLSSVTGHVHPLEDPLVNPGLNLTLLALQPAGGDADASLDAGETLTITFTLTDDNGLDVDPGELDEVRAVLAGPTLNQQLLLDARVPLAALSGPQPFMIALPEVQRLEHVGASSAAGGEVFATASAPHFDVAGAETVVYVRGGAGAAATLAAPVAAGQNFVDLVTAAGFARGDVFVVEDGVPGQEEYLEVQFVEGDRLWLSSPNTPAFKAAAVRAHPLGAGARVVSLTALRAGVDYTLDAALGTITELVEFGAGRAVIVDSTTEYRLPARYPVPANGSPDLGEEHGEWSGLAVVPGTYSLSLWAHRQTSVSFAGETTFFPVAAPAVRAELQVLDAPLAAPYDLVDQPAACNQCHQDLRFHGGTARGFASCVGCHGAAGAEDLPRYVAANAPETPGVRAEFRELLHRVHQGRALDAPLAYQFVASGAAPYPDNFELRSFATIGFPAQPGGTRNCRKCHGQTNGAWLAPAPRGHPTAATQPTLAWRLACATCHDGAAAAAHIAAQTAPGGDESCGVCHGIGETWSVEVMHKPR